MKPHRFTLKTILIIITFTVLLFCLMLNLSTVWEALGNFLGLFAPVTIGLCLAFVLNVPMRALEGRVFAFMRRSRRKFVQKLVRPLSLILSLLLLIGVITLLIVVVVPDLREAFETLGAKLPGYFDTLKTWLVTTLSAWDIDTSWIENFTIDWKLVSDTLLSFLQSDDASNMLGGAASWQALLPAAW